MRRTELSVLFFILINVTLTYALSYVTVGTNFQYWSKCCSSARLIPFISVSLSSFHSGYCGSSKVHSHCRSQSSRTQIERKNIWKRMNAFSHHCNKLRHISLSRSTLNCEEKRRIFIFSRGKTGIWFVFPSENIVGIQFTWIISRAHQRRLLVSVNEKERFGVVQCPCVGRLKAAGLLCCEKIKTNIRECCSKFEELKPRRSSDDARVDDLVCLQTDRQKINRCFNTPLHCIQIAVIDINAFHLFPFLYSFWMDANRCRVR